MTINFFVQKMYHDSSAKKCSSSRSQYSTFLPFRRVWPAPFFCFDVNLP